MSCMNVACSWPTCYSLGFRVSIQSHQCGISLFSLPPLLVRISCTPILHCDHFSILTNAIIQAKVLAFSSRSCQEKSIFLESYYSDLSKTVMGRPQATRQIDHVSLILSKFSIFFLFFRETDVFYLHFDVDEYLHSSRFHCFSIWMIWYSRIYAIV